MTNVISMGVKHSINKPIIRNTPSLEIISDVCNEIDDYLDSLKPHQLFLDGKRIITSDIVKDDPIFSLNISSIFTNIKLAMYFESNYTYLERDVPDCLTISVFKEWEDIFSSLHVKTVEDTSLVPPPVQMGLIFIIAGTLIGKGYHLTKYKWVIETGSFSFTACTCDRRVTVHMCIKKYLNDYFNTFKTGKLIS